MVIDAKYPVHGTADGDTANPRSNVASTSLAGTTIWYTPPAPPYTIQSVLEIDVDKAKARATAEMLKAIDERPCTSCDYFEDIAKRLRTPKGAGGK